MVKCLPECEYFYCILKKDTFNIRRSKVTDYAALGKMFKTMNIHIKYQSSVATSNSKL